jgi:hypothetical protein
MKPLRCKEHKLENQRTQTYICICGSSKPRYGLETDNRPSCCIQCKSAEMIDILKKKCIKCKIKTPCFGLKGEKYTHCFNCKTDEMIDIKNKKCIKCKVTRPTFGFENDDATHCVKCKLDNMINVLDKKCLICNIKQPVFGLDGEKVSHCFDCKTPEMINIKDKKCIKCKITIPSFGIEDNKPTHCLNCKTSEMFDVIHNKCAICNKKRPCFGLQIGVPTHCLNCKSKNMFDVINKKCICGKSQPIFGLENDTIATCCIKCKTTEMINIKDIKCKSNYLEEGKAFKCLTQANKKYKGYCSRCYSYHFPTDPLTFQIRSRTKEQAVRDYINENFKGFQHDIPLWIGGCDCTHKRRIDHRKLIGNTLLCIETDEEQHKSYNKEDKEARYNDLMMIHGGKLIFIRFNPDKYKEKGKNKNPIIANRLVVLKDEIEKQIKRINNEENLELLEEIFLYYDKN